MSVFHNIFFFIVAIGILVTFHEFGHYWVARKLGVKVLRFSVGFGKPLFTWVRDKGGDKIEYVIAAIPLGGYVKMLDEREGEVSDSDKPRAFNTQPLLNRTLIVIAGPLFNFLLAIIFYWLVFVLGETVLKPVLGDPLPETLAQKAGFKNQDAVIAINDNTILSMNEFRIRIIEHGIDGGDIKVKVIDNNNNEQTRILQLGTKKILQEDEDVIQKLGFQIWIPKIEPIIEAVVKDSAAMSGGLQKGDKFLSINGELISHWGQMTKIVRNNPNVRLDIQILREDSTLHFLIIPKSMKNKNSTYGLLGVRPYVPEEIVNSRRTLVKYGFVAALPHAIQKTFDMSVLTLTVLWKMLKGEASLANISGPITIAQYAGITATIGFTTYIGFLALISISLGIINLLPIPMLDGGHLFYYLIEAFKGEQVSEAFQIRGQQVGIVLLGLLMFIAIFNDIHRLL